MSALRRSARAHPASGDDGLRTSLLVPLLVLVALLGSGCAGLPEDGEVEVGDGPSPTSSAAPFDFNPPGPEPDASPVQIVAGFLRALQATPVSTRFAAEFLTEDAAAEWRPDERTIVYDGHRLSDDTGQVTVRLDEAFALDGTGRWVGALPDEEQDATELGFGLAREGGQWRIAAAPDAMIIPQSHFATRYREYSLHFFDPTGSVLVPEPVYLPWGPQGSTLLVAGLLAGPPRDSRTVERSFFPRSTRLGVGVPVHDDGVAEVPLSAEVLELGEDELELVLAQLAWTLRQVTEVDRLRITVDGTPMELPGGRSTVNVSGWGEFSPAIAAASTDLFGLRRKRVVQVVGGSELEAATLAGTGVGAARSLGVNLTGQLFAVVAGDGRRVVIVPRSGSETEPPSTPYTGTDVLAPMWDRTDRLWLVDRTAGGPSVVVVTGNRVRRLALPGLEGEEVVAAALSREGTRLTVAVEDGPRRSQLMMLRIVRKGQGAPVRLTRARVVPTPQPLVRVQSVGWRDPTTVAVLTRPSATTSEVVLASTDGSSGLVTLDSAVDVLFDNGIGMAASPGGPMALLVVTRSGRLHSLDVQGRWELDVATDGLRVPTFVG